MMNAFVRKVHYLQAVFLKRFDKVRKSKFFESPSRFYMDIDSSMDRWIQRSDIEEMTQLQWGEHCVECAAPDCYQTCDMFIEKEDGKCRRFLYGIEKSEKHSPAAQNSMKIVFLPWSNLLARTPDTLRNYDGFLLQIHSSGTKPIPVLFYLKDKEKKIKFMAQKDVHTGQNQFFFPLLDIKRHIALDEIDGVFVAPNVEDRTLLYVGCCEFVRLKGFHRNHSTIKCVALDLDGTLWEGILAEESPDSLVLNKEIVSSLELLKRKGFILSIVSKNHPEDALNCVKRFGLQDYFVFPQINWDAKSLNMKRLADSLNIDIHAIALVDDSAYEREEVKTNVNSRAMSPQEFIEFCRSEEVEKLSVSDQSEKRTDYYKTEEVRRSASLNFGSEDEFLRSVDATIQIQKVSEGNINRAHELIQRTNQLNFTGHRYTRDEINEFLSAQDRFECRVVSASDRFGDYGIIGFFILEMLDEREWFIQDLMFSCRIQGRQIDRFVIQQILEKAKKHGVQRVRGVLALNSRNENASMAFTQTGFDEVRQEGSLRYFVFELTQNIPQIDYITLDGRSSF